MPGTDLHADDHLVRTNGGGREARAVQHQMRSPRHQQRILRAGGLAFAAVGEHDRATAAGRDGAELDGCGEARASSAVQPRRLDDVDQRLVVPAAAGGGGANRDRWSASVPQPFGGSELGEQTIDARRAGDGGRWKRSRHHSWSAPVEIPWISTCATVEPPVEICNASVSSIRSPCPSDSDAAMLPPFSPVTAPW